MAQAKEWLDVEVNSIKAIVKIVESDGYEKVFTKKVLRETFNIPFAIIKRLGREQLIEDREAYGRCELDVYPHRAEGVTGYRLLVDMAIQLPTDLGRNIPAAQRKGKAESMCRPWSKKDVYAPQLSILILNALELEPETLPNVVKRRRKVK